MDYYESSPVPKSGDTASGNGVGYTKIGNISSLSIQSTRGGFYMPDKAPPPSGGGASGTTYTIQICVNGTPMNLDVLVGAGTQPYPIS